MAAPVEAPDDFGQYIREGQAVGIIFDDRLMPITAGGDVVEGCGCLTQVNTGATRMDSNNLTTA